MLHCPGKCPGLLPKQLLLLELRARATRRWHRWKHTLAIDHGVVPTKYDREGRKPLLLHLLQYFWRHHSSGNHSTNSVPRVRFNFFFSLPECQTNDSRRHGLSPRVHPTVPMCSSAPRRRVRASPLAPSQADACGDGKVRARVSHFPARLFTPVLRLK